ncbi:MAG: fatty acid CoA ligase family protein [Coraliomargaritaceae bacterium]
MAVNVAQYLSDQAELHPNGVALRVPQGQLSNGSIHYIERSFVELEKEASCAAHYFSKAGVQRGTRVLLMVRPGLDLIRIVFALFKIGAVPVVIDPGMGLQQFLRCVRHTNPEVLVGIPKAIWLSRILPGNFRQLRGKIAVDQRFSIQINSSTALGAYPVVDSGEDELAAILFTSGSTGPAKGVCYTHGMFAAQVTAIRQQYGITPGEIDLPMLPVFALFNPALGMCTVVPEMDPSRPAKVDPAKIVAAILQNEVTNSFGSPALWSKIARYCQSRGVTLPSIRRILMAGAAAPPSLLKQLKTVVPNGEIHTPYGATEALPVSSISATEVLEETGSRTEMGEGTCVGLPLPGVEVRIVEPVDGSIESMSQARQLGLGEIGEIVVRGPSVTQSYDNLPVADAGSKISDGASCWHRMGDLGWLEEGGRLWFCGRKAERVLTSGGTLYTDCCEAIFNQHSKVFRSALIDLGNGCAGLVVEPEAGAMPVNKRERESFVTSLRQLGAANAKTAPIEQFFFAKAFPVDVRHNAKIHRLSLARKYRIA